MIGRKKRVTQNHVHLLRRHFHDPNTHCVLLAFSKNSLRVHRAMMLSGASEITRKAHTHHYIPSLCIRHVGAWRGKPRAHDVCSILNSNT